MRKKHSTSASQQNSKKKVLKSHAFSVPRTVMIQIDV